MYAYMNVAATMSESLPSLFTADQSVSWHAL